MGKGKASKVKRKEESGLKIDFSPLFFSRDTFEKSEGKGKITWDEKIFKIRLFKMIFPITIITRLSCMEEVGFSFRKNKRRRRKNVNKKNLFLQFCLSPVEINLFASSSTTLIFPTTLLNSGLIHIYIFLFYYKRFKS